MGKKVKGQNVALEATNPASGRPGIAPFRLMKLSDLHEDPANARKHGDRNRATIRSSVREFGQVVNLVVQRGTGRVLGGNCTLGECRNFGMEEVMCSEVDVHGVDATRLAIVLNRSAEFADWDFDVLSETLRAIGEEDEALLDGVGWTADEVEAMAKMQEVPDFAPDGDGAPDLGALKPYKCPHCGQCITLKELKDSQ